MKRFLLASVLSLMFASDLFANGGLAVVQRTVVRRPLFRPIVRRQVVVQRQAIVAVPQAVQIVQPVYAAPIIAAPVVSGCQQQVLQFRAY